MARYTGNIPPVDLKLEVSSLRVAADTRDATPAAPARGVAAVPLPELRGLIEPDTAAYPTVQPAVPAIGRAAVAPAAILPIEHAGSLPPADYVAGNAGDRLFPVTELHFSRKTVVGNAVTSGVGLYDPVVLRDLLDRGDHR